eukprot:TRINITY_DN6524_c0_g1_i1.p1 TRINITY_DN6524_c0_g1~~TRINITY_DN6524_c0_g1_i1.p1  ORF type:complete len:541 (-),score=150.98 TRINITY_DN6524_c0_g1_i1:146-1549(-)
METKETEIDSSVSVPSRETLAQLHTCDLSFILRQKRRRDATVTFDETRRTVTVSRAGSSIRTYTTEHLLNQRIPSRHSTLLNKYQILVPRRYMSTSSNLPTERPEQTGDIELTAEERERKRQEYQQNYDKNKKSEWFKGSAWMWFFLFIFPLIFILWNVERDEVPITHRRRWMLIKKESEEAMGHYAFEEIIRQNKGKILPPNHPDVKAVRRVGLRLIKNSGIPELQKLNWKFIVINSPEVNAFVLPGGKVCVYTGILPIMRNEEGMAAVLGHEIGHVIARHGAEQVGSATFIRFILSRFNSGFLHGLGGLFIQLKFSRERETEADEIGLILMGRACYNPNMAADMWQRMIDAGEDKTGTPVVRLLSSHPTHQERISGIKKHVKEAVQEAKKNNCLQRLSRQMSSVSLNSMTPAQIEKHSQTTYSDLMDSGIGPTDYTFENSVYDIDLENGKYDPYNNNDNTDNDWD